MRGTHPILLENGRVIDPARGVDQVSSLLLRDGVCRLAVDYARLPAEVERIDLSGKWVMPGLIDMHVHLREPGEEYKETIVSGAQAAAAGGFTAVACMPNTKPVLDSEAGIALVVDRAREALVRVYPVGAISKASQGEQLAEFGEMRRAGAVAVSDDGRPVVSSQMMRRALEYAGNFDLPVISHCEELSLSQHGAMNEGELSTRLGLGGIPNAAESVMVYRDLALAALTGHRLHLAHISARESVALIRWAKAQGWPVTAETAPHYFTLTEEAVGRYDTRAKMNPPLRLQADVDAVIEGLKDGTIDAIASDHAPHSELEKEVEFDRAANGIIGLETSLPLALRLVRDGAIDPARLVELMSANPARILGVPGGTLAEGGPADVTVIDPEREFVYGITDVASKGRNSPFLDWRFTGQAVLVIVGGRVVLRR
ncbi:MAG: dihydroorotase [Desulfobacteraceae bacterium]|nr:dihydroorotase [Desulfobacteraceae bacterium]